MNCANTTSTGNLALVASNYESWDSVIRCLVLTVLATMFLSCLGGNQCFAQSFETKKSITADWSWWEDQGPNDPPIERFGSSSTDQFALGALNEDINTVGATTTVDTFTSVAGNGSFRSSSILDVQGPNAGNEGFGSLTLEAVNQMTFSDQLFSNDPNAFLFIFQPQVSGSFHQYGELLGDNAYVGQMSTFASADLIINGENLSGDFIFDDRENAFEPLPIDQYEPFIGSNSAKVFVYDGSPVDFNLVYKEKAMLAIDNVDALGFNMYVENDFTSTVELFANVYDVNGNLLEGVQVQSTYGMSYRNFSSVPEPGSLGLILLAGLVTTIRRKRQL